MPDTSSAKSYHQLLSLLIEYYGYIRTRYLLCSEHSDQLAERQDYLSNHLIQVQTDYLESMMLAYMNIKFDLRRLFKENGIDLNSYTGGDSHNGDLNQLIDSVETLRDHFLVPLTDHDKKTFEDHAYNSVFTLEYYYLSDLCNAWLKAKA